MTTHRILPLAILLYFLNQSTMSACSCGGIGPASCGSASTLGEVTFVGTVVATEDLDGPARPGAPPRPGKRLKFTFEVEEMFHGLEREERHVELYSEIVCCTCGIGFNDGEKYLVFAYRMRDGKVSSSICTRTRPIERAAALLQQLRNIRDGRQEASLYGMLQKEQQPYSSVWMDDFDGVLGGTVIRVSDGTTEYETQTDAKGAYAFYDLPAGHYKFSGDLASGLVIGKTISSTPPGAVSLKPNTCFEYNPEAVPRGRIAGRIVDRQGSAVQTAHLELYRLENYSPQLGTTPKGSKAPLDVWWDFSDKNGAYEFNHILPGDYILVFNRENKRDASRPYPRTFYPDVTEFTDARVIHIAEGQEALDSNIIVSGGEQVRTVRVRVLDIDRQPHLNASVTIKPEGAEYPPFPRKLEDSSFVVSLFPSSRYTFQANSYCFSQQGRGATQSSEPLLVDATNDGLSEVILIIPAKACPR